MNRPVRSQWNYFRKIQLLSFFHILVLFMSSHEIYTTFSSFPVRCDYCTFRYPRDALSYLLKALSRVESSIIRIRMGIFFKSPEVRSLIRSLQKLISRLQREDDKIREHCLDNLRRQLSHSMESKSSRKKTKRNDSDILINMIKNFIWRGITLTIVRDGNGGVISSQLKIGIASKRRIPLDVVTYRWHDLHTVSWNVKREAQIAYRFED